METSSIWRFFDDDDLEGYTFVIPSVAVGNVGQLACDLMISSLSMTKYSSVYSSALIPVVGYDPYDLDSEDLMSSCEVYKCASRKLAVLQLRAPLVIKYAKEFLNDLVDTFEKKGVKEFLILSSSYAHENKYVQQSPYRYLVSDNSLFKERIKEEWLEHEKLDGDVKIFGGGFAAMLYTVCNEKEMPHCLLYKYCSEGDNIPDAYDMVQNVSHLLDLFKDNIQKQLIRPVSWNLLFGRPPPYGIY